MDSIKKKMDSIQVAIKVRPLIKREVDEGLQSQWEVKGNSIITKDPELVKRADYRYSFDHIFNEKTTNDQVFKVIVKPIIDAAVNGFNGTVFAYGQTSSGKTYTMMGSDTDPGITQLAVQHMFDAIDESKDREFLLRVAYLEIYNEKVKDLLAKGGTEVKIHEAQGGIVNIKCKEQVINSPENVFFIMKKGEKNRKVGETNMNERSSRGHTIFRITIESRAVDADSDGAIQVSQINLVDLAGSERQRQAGTAGERFKEGMHINLSLTMLGKVIKQLSEGQDFISFRDSKLTRLLQNPLSGNALIAVICAVTPASLEETSCSLSFASRVKSIKTKPQVNEVMSDAALLKRYAKQIEKLNTELERLKKGNQLVDVQEMESRLQEKVEANQVLIERIALLKRQFVTGYSTHKEEEPSKTFSRRRTWCGSGTLRQNLMKLSSDIALETITEMSPDKPSRKSIIQNVDLMNHTFEDFADFEMDLIESERDRLTTRLSEDGIEDKVSVRKRNARKRVEFSDDVWTYEPNYRTRETTPEVENIKNTTESDNALTYENLEITPEKKDTSCQTRNIPSPGTPKEVLRESLSHLEHEYNTLREYTKLEKQILCEDSCKHVQELENLQRHIVKLNFEKDNFERMSTDLHNELQKVKQESQNIQKNIMQDNEDLLKRLKTLTDSKMSLGEINAKLKQDLDQKIKESEEIKMESSKLNEDLLVKVKGLTDTQMLLEETNSKLMLDLNQKTRELEELQKNALQQNEDFIKQVKELTDGKKSLELTNANLVKDLETAEHELSNLRETCSQNDNDLSDKLKKLMDEKQSLEDLNANLMINLQEKVQKLNEVEEERLKHKNDLLNEMEKLKESKESTEKLNTALMTDLEEERQKMKELQNKVSESEGLSQKIQELMDTKVSLEELNSKLNMDLEAERQKLEEFQSKTSHNEDLSKQIQELMDARISLEEMNSKLKMDLEEERQKLEEFQSKTANNEDLSKQIQELMDTRISLEEMNSKLKIDLEEERQKLEEFQNKTANNEDLSKQIQELTDARVSLEELNSKLKMDLEEERQKLEEFQSKASHNEDLSRQIQDLTDAKVSLEQLNSKLKMDLEGERLKLEEFQNNKTKDEHLSRQIQEITNDKVSLEELKSEMIADLQTQDCASIKAQEQYPAYDEFLNKVKSLTDDKLSLEEINAKLMVDLQAKIQESEEIQRDICGLKTDITQLQKTIHLLTSENLELSTKLSTQLQKTEEERNEFQEKIEELYQRIATVTNEKISLEDNITLLTEKLNTTRPRTPEVIDDNIQEKILKYQEKIDSLTEENIKLSINITEKEKEINDLRESNSLKYDHHCKYSEEVEKLKNYIEVLKSENTELSSDVMEKIADLDVANEQYESLKSKYDMSLQTIADLTVGDMHQIKEENNKLKNELVDLRSKIRTLSSENENFSKYLSEAIEQSDLVHNASNLENSKLHLSSLFNDSFVSTNSEAAKITELQNQVEHLKHLNKKLSELKLSRCTQCGYLKELNESYRANKLEVSKLQRKIDIYERQLKHKSAEVELLLNKTHEDLNLSGHDCSFNTSLIDGMNITQAEEKLDSLCNEFEIIKTDDESLQKLLNDNNIGQERLQDDENNSEVLQASDDTFQTEKPSNNHKVRKEKLEKGINQLKDELQEMRQKYSKYSTQIDQFISIEKAQFLDEINILKSTNTKLQEQVLEYELTIETLNDRPKILEEEVSKLMEKIKQLSEKEKSISDNKLYLEVELEDLKTGIGKRDKMINELQQTITQLNDHLSSLEHEIELLRKENKDLLAVNEKSSAQLSSLTTEIEKMKTQKEELQSLKANYEESWKESENKLNKYMDENESLKQEIMNLKENIQNNVNKDNTECKNKLTDDPGKSKEELSNIKETIIKEIKCLKPTSNTEDLSSKSVDELFRTFFEAIMLKEAEIAEAMQTKFNKAKQKLEDEKRQSADVTKRMTLWVKELEAENEKLQADLTEQEMMSKKYEEKISQLEHSLKETNNEKSILMEKIVTLETEFNSLQAELEKRPKLHSEQEEIISQQKREKIVHEAVMKKEAELQSKFNAEKEEYERKICDLTRIIDTYKTKIMELKNTIEGLEANEKQLKNIIDIKSSETTISVQRLEKVEAELVQVTNECSELNRDLEEKKMHIAEIKALMKTKCDLLSEYKSKVETITPEYEALIVQAQERKMSIERCKIELENVKIQKQKEIDVLKDQLNSETVKCTSLNKQITDLTNKNINIVSELNELQSKYEELERVNLKLERRIRNSTSKIKAETEIENLRDINKALESNLEGANNRIAELQENKKQLLTELMNLRGQYDCMCSENNELKQTLCSYKSKLHDSDLLDLRTKYDNLLQNKNKIALELEEKKLLLNQKIKDHENYVKQINELIEKNKELDEECEELANEIRKKNTEYAEMEGKYFSLIVANQQEQSATGICSTSVKQLDELKRENAELKEEVESLKSLKKELCAKIKKLENINRSRNNSGSPSSISPSLDNNGRRRSRNDFLDQKRQIEDKNSDEMIGEQCEALRKKIHELELELVSKNGKLATLEMQIQSENFPYQRKCKDLEEKLLAVMNKNAELKNEIKRLQRAMRDIGSRECDICRRWQTNKRDQTTQTIPDNVIRFCGTSSGVVEEHVKIQKLEKAHALMKNLCRTRNRRIKELEDRIKELEEKEYSSTVENLQENVDRANITKTCSEKKPEHDMNFRL